MGKIPQIILLVLVISIGIAARLSILGWLFIIGISTSVLFGFFHFFIHFYSLNYFESHRNKIPLIILSHLSFLGIFLFQSDADDARSYSVLTFVFGGEERSIFESTSSLLIASIVSYLIISFIIFKNARNNRANERNSKYILPSIVSSLILVYALINLFYHTNDLRKYRKLERKGEFRSINRAMRSPEKVEIFRIEPNQSRIEDFPAEILELPNIHTIHLNNQIIRTIPDGLERLKSLRELNLLDNYISEIPGSICECKKLEKLRVGGQIEEFPDCLKKMKTLRHLSIQSNSVNELMDELREFEYLETSHFYLKSGVLDREKLSLIRKETGIKHAY
jgi:hypothetical protein